MRPEEFRRGNLVLCYFKLYDKFVERKVEYVKDNEVYFFEPLNGAFSIKTWTSEIDETDKFTKGIPLTEEWHLKFISHGYWDESIRRCGHLEFRYTDGKIKCYVIGDDLQINYICQCEYVHEFQNTFYAFTGKELEIKK